MHKTFLTSSLRLSSIALNPFTLGDEKHEMANLKQRLAVLENVKAGEQETKSGSKNINVSGLVEF
jgi:hypothetical protein